MAKLLVEPYSKGQKITLENPNEELGAVLYVDKNGFVSEDSWLKRLNREEKIKSKA